MILVKGTEDELRSQGQPSPIVARIFALYDWNTGPVYITDNCQSLVAIVRELPLTIDLSPASPRKVTSE